MRRCLASNDFIGQRPTASFAFADKNRHCRQHPNTVIGIAQILHCFNNIFQMTASKAKFDALFHKYGSLWRSLSSHPDVLREIATIESIVSSRHHNDTVHTPNDPSQINQILDISDPSLNINLSSTHARSRFDPSVLSIHDSRDDDSSSASRVNVSKECIIDLVSSSSESIIEIDLSHLKINDDGEVVDDRDRKNTSDFGYDKFPSKLIDCSSSISSHSSSLGDECEWEEIKDAVCLSTSEHSYSSTSFDVLVVDDDSISNGNVSDYEDEDECVPPLDTTSRPVSKSMRLEFTRQRDALTQQYFDMFNETVFEHSLSEAHILWSKILRTTAGYCKCRTKSQQNQRMAEIELSIKVVDSEDKLKNTLMHEMCHAAAWLVDGITKPPHGECFKKWASLAMKRVSVPGENYIWIKFLLLHYE